jgi:hypothetical protein
MIRCILLQVLMAQQQIKPNGDQVLDRLYKLINPRSQDEDMVFILSGIHLNTNELKVPVTANTDQLEVQILDCSQTGPLFEARVKYLNPAYLQNRNYRFQNASRRVEVVYLAKATRNRGEFLPGGHTLPTPNNTDLLMFTAPLNHSGVCWMPSPNENTIRICHVGRSGESDRAFSEYLQNEAKMEWISNALNGVVGGRVGVSGRCSTPLDYGGRREQRHCTVVGFWSAAMRQWTLYAQVVKPTGDKGTRPRPRVVREVWRLYPDQRRLYRRN